MTRRGTRLLAAAIAIVALCVVLGRGPGASTALAQTPTPTPTSTPTPVATPTPAATGRIAGTVTDGTAGASLPDGLEVLLIELNGNTVASSRRGPVVGGAFAFAVVPDPALSFVLRLEYEGVPYFFDTVHLTPAQPAAQRDVTVYESTTTAPALAIQSTTVTLIAIDRAAGQLTLLREDLVTNPTDRVYVGTDGGPTLRLPAPDGATGASGLSADQPVQLEGGVATVGTPLLPGVTSVVTRYTVGYDRQTDRYRLRVTTPVHAARIEARAPARFIEAMDPVGDAQRAPDVEVQGEQLLVVRRDDTAPGQGLLADLIGLSGGQPAGNPLTDQPTAALAAVLALVVVAGGAFAVDRWRGRGNAS